MAPRAVELQSAEPAEHDGANSLGQLVESLSPDEAAAVERAAELDRLYGDDAARELEDFVRAHGCSPAEWLRRRAAER